MQKYVVQLKSLILLEKWKKIKGEYGHYYNVYILGCNNLALATKHWGVAKPLIQGEPTMVCHSYSVLYFLRGQYSNAAKKLNGILDCLAPGLARNDTAAFTYLFIYRSIFKIFRGVGLSRANNIYFNQDMEKVMGRVDQLLGIYNKGRVKGNKERGVSKFESVFSEQMDSIAKSKQSFN